MPSNEFTTLNKKVHRGGAYYINYYNLRLWLESDFPGYCFVVNADITDNTIAVNMSKVLPDDDIGKREIHVACTKIPIEFIIDNDYYKIRHVIQDAINRR